MKTNLISKNSVIPLVLMLSTVLNFAAFAQRSPFRNFRHYDKRGINVFEPAKEDTIVFDGLALRLGGNFTQGFRTSPRKNSSGVPWYNMGAGFPLAQANMNIRCTDR